MENSASVSQVRMRFSIIALRLKSKTRMRMNQIPSHKLIAKVIPRITHQLQWVSLTKLPTSSRRTLRNPRLQINHLFRLLTLKRQPKLSRKTTELKAKRRWISSLPSQSKLYSLNQRKLRLTWRKLSSSSMRHRSRERRSTKPKKRQRRPRRSPWKR